MSIAEGALAALQTGQQVYQNQYNANRERELLTLAREKQDQDNLKFQQEQEKLGYRNVIGDIHAHTNKVRGEQWNSQDWLKLQKDRPDLVVKMSKGLPGFNEFETETGEKVGAALVRYRENKENGTYTPIVRRLDTGEEVPMTKGRSEKGDDPKNGPVMLTPEEFTRNLNSRYQAAITRGGLEDNVSVVLAGANTQQQLASQLRESTLDAVGASQASPAEKSEFYYLVNQTDDIDALKQIYEQIIGGADEFVAGLEAQFREKQGAQATEGSVEALLADKGITKEKWDNYTPEMREKVLKRLNTAQRVDYLTDITGGAILADIEDKASMPWDALVNAKNWVADSALGRLMGLSEIDSPERPMREFDTATQENVEAAKRKREPVTAEAIDAAFTAPQFELTPENIRQAIISGTENPTEEQKAQIGRFLQSKGINNDKELIEAQRANEITQKEANMVAWVMGATHSGSSSDKAALTQKLMNSFERGDMDLGRQGAANIDLAYKNYAQSIVEYKQGLAESDQTAALDGVSESIALHNDIAGYLGIKEDGTWNADDANLDSDQAKQIARRLTPFIAKMRTAVRGGKSAQAYLDGLNPALSLYLQSRVDADEASPFNSEFYKDFFRFNAPGSLTDFDLKEVRFDNYKDGKPTSFVYVDEKGVRSQAISIQSVEDDDPMVARMLRAAAEANSKDSK